MTEEQQAAFVFAAAVRAAGRIAAATTQAIAMSDQLSDKFIESVILEEGISQNQILSMFQGR